MYIFSTDFQYVIKEIWLRRPCSRPLSHTRRRRPRVAEYNTFSLLFPLVFPSPSRMEQAVAARTVAGATARSYDGQGGDL
jgi:hypothetical protein